MSAATDRVRAAAKRLFDPSAVREEKDGLEARLQEIDAELKDLRESDIEQYLTRFPREQRKEMRKSPMLGSMAYLGVVTTVRHGRPYRRGTGFLDLAQEPPAVQRAYRRRELVAERNNLRSRIATVQSKLSDAESRAAVKLTRAQREHFQSEVDRAARDLDLRDAMGRFSPFNEQQISRRRHLISVAEQFGIVPTTEGK